LEIVREKAKELTERYESLPAHTPRAWLAGEKNL
jgi:hypothetical protein